jgi:hypothetical protein
MLIMIKVAVLNDFRLHQTFKYFYLRRKYAAATFSSFGGIMAVTKRTVNGKKGAGVA